MYRKTFYVSWPVALAFVAVWLILMFLLARANDMINITLISEAGAFEDVLDEFNQIVAGFQSIE